MKKMIEALLGRRYYANIVNDMRTDLISAKPFLSKNEAMRHKCSLAGNASVSYVCTVSFRTRTPIEVN